MEQAFKETITALSPLIIGSLIGALINVLVITYIIWCIHKIQKNTKEINESLKNVISEYKMNSKPIKQTLSDTNSEANGHQENNDEKWMPKINNSTKPETIINPEIKQNPNAKEVPYK